MTDEFEHEFDDSGFTCPVFGESMSYRELMADGDGGTGPFCGQPLED